MNHDNAADHSCACSPASRPCVLHHFVSILKLYTKALGKILPEIMGSSCLQSFTVAHQRFDSIGAQCARELLTLALTAGYAWYRQLFQKEILVDVPQDK